MNKARLQEQYGNEIRSALQQQLNLKNVMETPKLNKIVINVGVKDADSKKLQVIEGVIAQIAGQKPVRTLARKSIAGFKLREDMPIGVMVTLRGKRMYEFLDRLINTALPKVRDFHGVTPNFDGQGNYNLGVKDWIIFPEVEYGVSDKPYGMNITIQTTAINDDAGRELLRKFGMPFREKK